MSGQFRGARKRRRRGGDLTADVRIYFLRGSDIGIATCIVTAELFDLATPVQCGGGIGIEPDSLVIVGDLAAVILLGGVGVAAVDEGMGIIGVEPDRLVIIHDGALIVFLGAVGAAAVVDGIGVIRIKPGRLIVVRYGGVDIALGLVRGATAVEGKGGNWVRGRAAGEITGAGGATCP